MPIRWLMQWLSTNIQRRQQKPRCHAIAYKPQYLTTLLTAAASKPNINAKVIAAPSIVLQAAHC